MTIQIKTGPALTALGGLLLVIGSMLPWVTANHVFGSMSVSGTEGDGIFTLVLGLVLLIGAVARMSTEGRYRWLIVVAAAAALLAVFEFVNIRSTIDDVSNTYVRGSIGPGLWIIAIGSATALYGVLTSDRQSAGPRSQGLGPSMYQLNREARPLGLVVRVNGSVYELVKPPSGEVLASGTLDDIADVLR
jgi:hypothetical protein